MSRLVSRILLAVLMIPAAGLVDLTTFILIERHPWGPPQTTLIANLATCVFIDLYWFLLWRASVRWTRQRVRRTFWALGLSFLAGGAIGWMVSSVIDYYGDGIQIFIGLMSAPTLWLIATIFIWRETPAERSERLK